MALTKSLPILPIADLRNKAKEILDQVRRQPVVITQKGRPRAVLVDYDAYNELIERLEILEDTRDALIIARASETAREFVSAEELLQQYERVHGEALSLEEEAALKHA